MQTILTKYIPATNHRPARVKAKQQNEGEGQTVTVGWDDYWSATTEEWDELRFVSGCHDRIKPHALAARRLMKKLGWTGEMIAGNTDSGTVWVFTDTTDRITNDCRKEYLGQV